MVALLVEELALKFTGTLAAGDDGETVNAAVRPPGLDVPIVPVYLDRVWGSVFSYKGGKFLWKWPARFPYPVTVSFGAPLAPTTSAAEVRIALMAVGARATTASIMTCRRCLASQAGYPAGPQLFFGFR